jgi:hypothetical protein
LLAAAKGFCTYEQQYVFETEATRFPTDTLERASVAHETNDERSMGRDTRRARRSRGRDVRSNDQGNPREARAAAINEFIADVSRRKLELVEPSRSSASS